VADGDRTVTVEYSLFTVTVEPLTLSVKLHADC